MSSGKAVSGVGRLNSSGSGKSNKSYSPKSAAHNQDRYIQKQTLLHGMGYNDAGARRDLNQHSGRNFMGASMNKNIVNEYNQYARDLNNAVGPQNLHSGPANINIGERSRQVMRNQ